MARGRKDRLRVELHTFNRQGAMPKAHDDPVSGVRGHLENVGNRRRVNHERVVPGRLEWAIQTCKDTRRLVVNHRGLAVHDLWRRNHGAAEDLADALVAETDPEHGDPARSEVLNRSRADTGILGTPWARRDQQKIRGEGQQARYVELVVSDHYGLSTELTQVLHKVVDEAVVVVDHENPRRHAPRLPATREAPIA